MFKISRLTFESPKGESFDYEFNSGLNYFVGGNNTGKTEFYKLIDFMLGDTQYLEDIECYKDCVESIKIELLYRDSSFTCIRTKDIDRNFIFETSEVFDPSDILSHNEYRKKLNSIFTTSEKNLQDLRDFANEELSYRIFTMFNFLDEKTQGKTQDFLSKCSDFKYAYRLNIILNFIFNKNIAEIKQKEDEITQLKTELTDLIKSKSKYDFILNTINEKLQIIAPNYYFTGKNIEEIKGVVTEIKGMNTDIKASGKKDVADLEVMYNSLAEQIKKYQNEMADIKNIKKYDTNRITLLSHLNDLVEKHSDLNYLISPIKNLINDLNEGISFGDYILKDKTIKKLQSQLEEIKRDLQRNDARFEMYSLPAKEKAVAIIEECLASNISLIDEEKITEIRKKISDLKKDILALQNADDISAIDNFSSYVTNLYLSLKGISSFVSKDANQKGFKIKYIKRGNVLQPVCSVSDKDDTEQNYYPGSMARHIVVQLCGYAAFLSKLLKENKYPIVPIFVIDHISKPFDDENCKVIGTIISSLLEDVGKDNLQIFMFDSENSEKLGIDSMYSKDLVTESKTGLCPFFGKK
jgi:hypothetical protein